VDPKLFFYFEIGFKIQVRIQRSILNSDQRGTRLTVLLKSFIFRYGSNDEFKIPIKGHTDNNSDKPIRSSNIYKTMTF